MTRETVEIERWPRERWLIERRAGWKPGAAWILDCTKDYQLAVKARLELIYDDLSQRALDAEALVRVRYGWVDKNGAWTKGPEKVWPT